MPRQGVLLRARACRGIGATFPDTDVDVFDAALAGLLEEVASEPFSVRCRLDAPMRALKDRQQSVKS